MEQQSHLGLLKFSGDDAVDFLQGQLTNDVRLANLAWQFSAYCNPKGRALALFYVWRNDEEIFAILHRDLLDSIRKRLTMYVMRSKVSIEEVSNATFIATEHPKEMGSLEQTEDSAILGFANSTLTVHFSGARSETDTGDVWRSQLIKAGLPQIEAVSSELFIPQMINLDLLGGINFKKGCYTGQEIVARMHYLGKLKQRMMLLEISGANKASELSVGDKLTLEDKSIGNVVNVSTITQQCLAVLRLETASQMSQTQGSSITSANGVQLTISEEQPYELPVLQDPPT